MLTFFFFCRKEHNSMPSCPHLLIMLLWYDVIRKCDVTQTEKRDPIYLLGAHYTLHSEKERKNILHSIVVRNLRLKCCCTIEQMDFEIKFQNLHQNVLCVFTSYYSFWSLEPFTNWTCLKEHITFNRWIKLNGAVILRQQSTIIIKIMVTTFDVLNCWFLIFMHHMECEMWMHIRFVVLYLFFFTFLHFRDPQNIIQIIITKKLLKILLEGHPNKRGSKDSKLLLLL